MKLSRWVLLVTIAGCASESSSITAPEPQIVTPPCSEPASLLGHFDPQAAGYIVIYRAGTDAQLETERLAAKYGFVARFVYTHATQGFSALLEPTALALVRCEPTVSYAEFNSRVSIAGM